MYDNRLLTDCSVGFEQNNKLFFGTALAKGKVC